MQKGNSSQSSNNGGTSGSRGGSSRGSGGKSAGNQTAQGGTSQSRGGTSRGSGGKAAGNQTVQVETSSGTCYTHASNVKLVDRLARDMANASAPDLPYYERQHLAEHFARKFWDD